MMTNRYNQVSPATAPILEATSTNTAWQGSAGDSGQKHLFGAIVIGIVTLLLVASFSLCLRRSVVPYLRKRRLCKGCLTAESLSLRRFHLEELVRATNNFGEECLLGSGACGSVYKGTFEAQGITLAIKKAHADSYQSVEEFQNEVTLLSKVKHRNLVGLVGFCEEPGANGAKVLVYEYVANGCLLDYITGRKGRKSLTWRQRVNIAIGAAKGIAHLHDGVKPSIIHRDIKPSNILLGHGFEAKVSDFGLVKLGPIGGRSHVSTQIKGTPGYLDPAYCSSLHLSPFTDVYSFGVILLQLLAARPAVDTIKNGQKCHIIEWARPSLERGNVEEILDANLLTEPCNMKMMVKMGQLGLRCVVRNPKERPTMTQVWQELEAALCSVDSSIHREPTMDQGPPPEYECSESFVSVDGVQYQRFRVDMECMSLRSASLRCLEASSVSIEIGHCHNFRRVGGDERGKEEGSAHT